MKLLYKVTESSYQEYFQLYNNSDSLPYKQCLSLPHTLLLLLPL